jgi:ATP-dependent Clp protease ATP-binding subunit ClpB
MGPTGVGKTELARALADFLFDDEQAMVRIDMSEYQEKHAVSRLIGAPPGYVGFEEGGQLTEAIRRRPYAVILFDEIEKAHPEVFNVLLQVLDDGRLTDSRGRTVDFRHAVIIMTSNVGSEYIQEYATDYEKMKSLVMEAMHQRFKPEFLNRIDEFVIFHSLDMKRIREIVDIQVKRLEERLREKKFGIELSEAARELLAREGYQPAFGARPLKRVIQRLIQDPLARRIIAGEIEEGTMITVDSDGEKMVFTAEGPSS